MKKNQTIELPVLPLRGLMLFPNMVLHFDVGRKKSLAALEQGMMEQQKVFLISQKSDDTEDPGWKDEAENLSEKYTDEASELASKYENNKN